MNLYLEVRLVRRDGTSKREATSHFGISRANEKEMSVSLAHAPGHAQAAISEVMVLIGEVEQKAYFFAIDLPHSDACCVRAYPAAVLEAWVDGDLHAFAIFGRVPQSVLYDNDRCLVAKILPDGSRKRTKLYLDEFMK